MDIEGAYCYLRYGKGNSCYSRRIKSFNGEKLYWDDTNFYSQNYSGEDGLSAPPGNGGLASSSKFFIVGKLDLLDSPTEWVVQNNNLYFYAPDGMKPEVEHILIQTEDYTIIEEEIITNVIIEGVDFIGTSVMLKEAEHIKFKDVHFKYIGSELLFTDRQAKDSTFHPVSLNGHDISFEKCLFAGAQNTALELTGHNISIQNCIFIENNRHANFESRPVSINPLGKYTINDNTFFNNSSDAIYINNFPSNDSYLGDTPPEIAYNNIFNGGLYNSDVSGIYFPTRRQHFTDVHHNWIHNVHGTCIRLDLIGWNISMHHNLLWNSLRGFSLEGFENFNIYNNTDLYNEKESDITRNLVTTTLTGEPLADVLEPIVDDLSYPPISEWNVLNNIVMKMQDRIGPREVSKYKTLYNQKITHPERNSLGIVTMTDVGRGKIKRNIFNKITYTKSILKNGSLLSLNPVPKDSIVKTRAWSQTDELYEEHVKQLGDYLGAYDVNGEYWYAGSNWMPQGILSVPKTVRNANLFSMEYESISIVPSFKEIVPDIISNTQESNSISEQKIKTYPNPVEEMLHIDMFDQGNYAIKILTTKGINIFEKEISTTNEKTISLDLSDLDSGYYIYNILKENGKSITGEFIKK